MRNCWQAWPTQKAAGMGNDTISKRSALVAATKETFGRACALKTASFKAGPLLWLTHETLGTKTEDAHAHAKGTSPVAPFPKMGYFVEVMGWMLESERLFIIKSREMMTSWLACGYIA